MSALSIFYLLCANLTEDGASPAKKIALTLGTLLLVVVALRWL